MGIQFFLGVRAERNHRNYFGDSRHSGSVGENLGELSRRPAGRRKKRRPLGVHAPTGLLFNMREQNLSYFLPTSRLMLRVLSDKWI
jgi:hypothetical protein